MSKQPTTKPENGKGPKQAIETLVGVGELVLAYRASDDSKPTLSTVARLMNRASGLLRLDNVDTKLEVENAATIALARKLSLIA